MIESLFTSQVPSVTNASDGGASGITTATGLYFTVNGSVEGVRWYAPTDVAVDSYTVTAELWEMTSASTGTRLASKAVSNGTLTGGAWNSILFDTPVDVTDLTPYRVAINDGHNSGRYVATLNFFSASDLSNGSIVAWRNATDPLGIGNIDNGTFAANSAANTYPNTQINQTCYFVDVLFENTTVVSKTFELYYDTKSTVSKSVAVQYDTIGRISTSFSIQYNTEAVQVVKPLDVQYDTSSMVVSSPSVQYDIRERVANSVVVQHNVLQRVYPAKVLSFKYDVRKAASRIFGVVYGVRVPIASPKSFSMESSVRERVVKALDLVFDVGIVGPTQVSKSVGVRYHALVTSTVDKLLTTPVSTDELPPQIVTTSF